MQRKLLALDLDGTVLTSDHTVSPALIEAVKSIAEVAHVMIVTGRHHVAAEPFYRQLGLNTPIICCNGTYMYDFGQQEVLSENSIAKDTAAQFIDLSEQHDLKMVMYVKDAMLYSNQRPINYMEDMLTWSQTFPAHQRPNIRRVEDFRQELAATDYVWKFVVEGGDVETFGNIDFVSQHFIGEQSWVDRVDFSAIGNSKGNRLTRYVEQLGISLEDCVAVGDNHNDISMLSKVGLGIAMQNADDKVKQHADRVTEHNNNHVTGLADELKALFL